MAGAINQDGPEITLYASTDLSSYQFHVVTLDTDGYVKLADDSDDPVEALIGVLQNKPNAAGEEAVVRIDSVAKVMGSATIAPGIWVSVDGNGHIAAAAALDNVVGYTLETATVDELSEIMVKPGAGYVAPA